MTTWIPAAGADAAPTRPSRTASTNVGRADADVLAPTLDELVRTHLPGLIRYVTVLVGDQHTAADLVQEVLLRAHQRWRRIALTDRPDLYLNRMVTNEHLSWRRRWHVAAALSSREPSDAETATAAYRIADRVARAANNPGRTASPTVRRAGWFAVTGVLTSTIAVTGAGAAAAANPYTGFAVGVESLAQTVGVEWSAMPDGYTREQYEAFWNSGYTAEDVTALTELWHTDATAAKARAGQLIVDGENVPVAPNSSGEPGKPASRAFVDAGYTYDDAVQLAELWQIDVAEAKIRAGDMVLDGRTPPSP